MPMSTRKKANMMSDNCQHCNKPREWHQLKCGYGQGSELFYTAPNGELVCADCLKVMTGKRPQTLVEINNARKARKS